MSKNIRFLIICAVAIFIGVKLSSFTIPINGQQVLFKSFIPNIVVPAETLFPIVNLPVLGQFDMTNTLFTTLIVDAIIILIVLAAKSGITGGRVTTFMGNALESFVELLYKNYMLPTLGARTKAVVPIAVSAFLFILISGFLELVPGVESIGKLEPAHAGLRGWCAVNVGSEHNPTALITGVEVKEGESYEKVCGYKPFAQSQYGELVASTSVSAEAHAGGYALIPYLRRPTSSLSTTLALALVAFIFIEIQGIKANGSHYFSRFFNGHALAQGRTGMMKGLIGNISAVVGILELLSEFIRIVSFSFRLFGNMFAGTVLVLVMMSILPVFIPTVFLGLEFGVAVIQAFVFLMLITVFTSLAVAHSEH